MTMDAKNLMKESRSHQALSHSKMEKKDVLLCEPQQSHTCVFVCWLVAVWTTAVIHVCLFVGWLLCGPQQSHTCVFVCWLVAVWTTAESYMCVCLLVGCCVDHSRVIHVCLFVGWLLCGPQQSHTCVFVCWLVAVWTTAESYMCVCLLVGCLTSQQHTSGSQGRICSDNFTCCHTQIELADQTFYLTWSQYTDTGPTSPSTDPLLPGACQGSHWSANF